MIKGFNRQEKKAIIAILKFIIHADGVIMDNEIAKFNELAERKGFEDFADVFNEVDREVRTLDDLRGVIAAVTSETHRNDILKYAVEIALADISIKPEEAQILKLVGKEWKINITALMKGK
ncbi:MAG TPA: TerB family tellurite resistance protein [Spirochaetota bacterium]|nr:TerB family tellurite resistance protein [Spirochaetota bacterium]HNT12241.1 TerB family tellurite resistance protein [Spirochaetota bacterium]HNV46930.1 TerB family tellurite resistance protein [Spirochaetota bacterium]HOS40086.1 TerB family tellurite resistance protein [Spirochaetota bacterium]HPU90545.1 TerB family tellurite resistance protein [Spirochaetota bacterium]